MPLSPTALVVRAGVNRDAEALRGLVFEAIEDGDGPVVSVFCGDYEDGDTRETLLMRICRDAEIPHGQVQVGSWEDVQNLGLPVVQETGSGEADSHHHVVFQDDVPLSQVQAFIGVLGEPEANPTGGKRRR